MALKNLYRLCALAFTALLIMQALPLVVGAADGIPRISIQDLRGKMDRKEKIIILDVRTGEDYEASRYKIPGAIRVPIDRLKEQAQEFPKETEIITYCA